MPVANRSQVKHFLLVTNIIAQQITGKLAIILKNEKYAIIVRLLCQIIRKIIYKLNLPLKQRIK